MKNKSAKRWVRFSIFEKDGEEAEEKLDNVFDELIEFKPMGHQWTAKYKGYKYFGGLEIEISAEANTIEACAVVLVNKVMASADLDLKWREKTGMRRFKLICADDDPFSPKISNPVFIVMAKDEQTAKKRIKKKSEYLDINHVNVVA